MTRFAGRLYLAWQGGVNYLQPVVYHSFIVINESNRSTRSCLDTTVPSVSYTLPLFLAFADPMYCAGLMLPPMIKGFRFRIIDMDNTRGDSTISCCVAQ